MHGQQNKKKSLFKFVLYSIWYLHTCRWPSGAQSSLNLCTGRPPTGVMIPDAV